MGKVTGISWTDHTFNPWWGCTRVSPGCDNCYAEAFDKRVGGAHWGKGEPRREFGEKHWNEPIRWNREAEKAGKKEMVFCASMADVMDDEAPEGARERLWKLIDETPHLIWQLLTKRPQRYDRYLPDQFRYMNVWLGFTAEDRANYELRWRLVRHFVQRRPEFLTWCSYEPALGLVLPSFCEDDECDEYPDWFIFGGESGNGRRECSADWARELLAECRERDIAFFMKQMGGRTPAEGKAAIQPELMIQEFPQF